MVKLDTKAVQVLVELDELDMFFKINPFFKCQVEASSKVLRRLGSRRGCLPEIQRAHEHGSSAV